MSLRRCRLAGVMLALALAGCGAPRPPAAVPAVAGDDAQVPPFARVPYQPFSRDAAVQIALREWRTFGSVVLSPGEQLPYDAERANGYWQRVGEYWWLGLPLGNPDDAFTGKHNQNGGVFPASRDSEYAWSAAFIDYVMRMAGAGHRFPYAPDHADYINAAKEHAMGRLPGLAITAEPPSAYAPQVGDLVCMWRGRHRITFDALPTGRFLSHCDIVVALHPGSIDGIGGNVADTVGMWRIPVTADGRLAAPDGTVIDPAHPWFVVLKVDYAISGPISVPVGSVPAVSVPAAPVS